MKTLSIYGSHDSSICLFDGGKYRILELEKFNSIRNCSLSSGVTGVPTTTPENIIEFYEYIKKTFNIDKCDHILHCETSPEDRQILTQIFGAEKFTQYDHHLAHAGTALYQSPYEEALIVSFDGGGMGTDGICSWFNIYIANRKNITLIARVPLNLGVPYEKLGIPVKEIRKSTNSLSYAGKMMGLVAYGKYRPELETPMMYFYYSHDISFLLNAGIPNIDRPDGIEGETSYDIAYMSQFMFEKLFDLAFSPYQQKYSHLPVCFTGGAALNVLNNQKWYEKLNGKLFVPPNPNDCGLAFGALVNYYNPNSQIDITYSGFDIIDRQNIRGKEVDSKFIAQKLSEGKIIGSIMNEGEIGPRALGNRSIICDPSFLEMKDTLNHKVKFREWFRPFAPIVRLKDVNKYFDFNGESRFMNFCPKIRAEFKHILPSIIHNDDTGRIQTISEDQHPYLYSVLTEFEKMKKHPVLLNTSFNIKGHSIITTVKDAFTILDTTQLDAVLIDGKWYTDKSA